MVTLSPGYTITLRVDVPASQLATSTVVAAVAIAEVVSTEEPNAAFVIPGVFDRRVAEAVAPAVRTEAERHWLSAPASKR
ncbi:hypothetical protein [Georgenia sp. AZ-5]|uniref:hypothetical protein n=1 Tax=Georgenia sp. AZ-5 TaxID=3367526 RepID=UPI003754E28A